MNCPACGTELAAGATFCPACRARGVPPVAAPVPLPPLASKVTPPVTENDPRERLFLILACVVSAGALAVPRLRRSRAFGPRGKWILGTFAVLQTTIAVAILVLTCVYARSIMSWYMGWLQDKSRIVLHRSMRGRG
ncbi:MAG TPA: zinc ribbon domain-containing protein [Planctomycetota bacterium]|nr:zinc ribbon domain-containing protein [Planctomycetota bacterium]